MCKNCNWFTKLFGCKCAEDVDEKKEDLPEDHLQDSSVEEAEDLIRGQKEESNLSESSSTNDDYQQETEDSTLSSEEQPSNESSEDEKRV